MKAIPWIALLAAVGILGSTPVFGQDSTAAPGANADTISPVASAPVPPPPEAQGIPLDTIQPNVLYLVRGDRLIKVEETPIDSDHSVDAGSVAKMAVGFGGPKSWMVLSGETSSLPVADPQPRFRIILDRATALMVRLGRFEVKDGKRRTQVDLSKQIDIFKQGMELKVEKAGEGIWDLVPEKPLEPGEYALAVGYGTPVADFTVLAHADGEE